MPIRQHAEQMRDLYANAIAETVASGREPSEHDLTSWMRYRDIAVAEDPAAELGSGPVDSTG